MKPEKDFFPIGATYAPLPKATEVDISEWPEDIANIKKLGLTVFRLFLCWDRVERERGKRDFSRIDRAFDLAEQNGLKVIGNVGGTFTNLQAIYPPRWLVYDLGCTLLKEKPEASEELHFNRFKLCYDDPKYQAEAKDFIQEAVARYKDRPSLIAWSGWNEPRLSECYCKHTTDLFRQWLKQKYTTLQTLEKAWSTEFPVQFRSWADVFPQPAANFEAGGYIPYLDWRRFLEQNRSDKFHMIRNWIREVDPGTPVISHLCGPYDADIFGEEDILGTSVYTIHAQGKGGDYKPYEFTFRQNIHFMSEGRHAHREDPEGFWVVETEAGPVSWVHNLVPRSYSPRKMNARDMLLVAHGARAVLRWLYRSRVTDAQAGEFNMVGWDGRMTERAEAFGSLAKFLTAHSKLFLSHTPERSGVLILDSRDCRALSECEGYQSRYNNSIHYLYNALLHIGIRAELCNVRQIMSGILEGMKVLYIPFHPHVDSGMANILREFVKNGGTVIAESPFAIKNTDGIHYEVTPGGLVDVFGAQVYDLEKLYEADCAGIPAFDFHAKIEVKGGVVEGRFANGDPAIVTNRYGKGRTVLYGTIFSESYQIAQPFHETANKRVLRYEEGEAYRQELLKRMKESGVVPGWELSDLASEDRKNIQVIFRRLPDGDKLLFVLNMDEKANRFKLCFSNAAKAMEIGCSDHGADCCFEGDGLYFHLQEWGWSVLRIPGK